MFMQLPVAQPSFIGVWQAAIPPESRDVDRAVWEGKRIRIAPDGTFAIYGLGARGKWRLSGQRLQLSAESWFDHVEGTLLHSMVGKTIFVDIVNGRPAKVEIKGRVTAATTWSPYPRPSVAILVKTWDQYDPNDGRGDSDYAYDELRLGGDDIGNEIAYSVVSAKDWKAAARYLILLVYRKDDRARLELTALLWDRRPKVSLMAARVIASNASSDWVPTLVEYAGNNTERRNAVYPALTRNGARNAATLLNWLPTLRSSSRGGALSALAEWREKSALLEFRRGVTSQDSSIRLQSLRGLWRLGATKPTSADVRWIIAQTQSGDFLMPSRALRILGEISQGKDVLVRFAKTDSWINQTAAIRALKKSKFSNDRDVQALFGKLSLYGNREVQNAIAGNR